MILRLALALALTAISCRANFLSGDFVPTSRRAQFHGERSQWHDVLGTHCPKFGHNRIVALPIPQPNAYTSGDDYKIQFSFDGDRVITPWLQLIGRRAPAAPSIVIDLVRSGDILISANAVVESVSKSDYLHYEKVRKEFSDPSVWPKHVLVSYRWTARHEVDTNRGLLVMFTFGVIAMFYASLSVYRAYNKQLEKFVDDVTSDAYIHPSAAAPSITPKPSQPPPMMMNVTPYAGVGLGPSGINPRTPYGGTTSMASPQYTTPLPPRHVFPTATLTGKYGDAKAD